MSLARTAAFREMRMPELERCTTYLGLSGIARASLRRTSGVWLANLLRLLSSPDLDHQRCSGSCCAHGAHGHDLCFDMATMGPSGLCLKLCVYICIYVYM